MDLSLSATTFQSALDGDSFHQLCDSSAVADTHSNWEKMSNFLRTNTGREGDYDGPRRAYGLLGPVPVSHPDGPLLAFGHLLEHYIANGPRGDMSGDPGEVSQYLQAIVAMDEQAYNDGSTSLPYARARSSSAAIPAPDPTLPEGQHQHQPTKTNATVVNRSISFVATLSQPRCSTPPSLILAHSLIISPNATGSAAELFSCCSSSSSSSSSSAPSLDPSSERSDSDLAANKEHSTSLASRSLPGTGGAEEAHIGRHTCASFPVSPESAMSSCSVVSPAPMVNVSSSSLVVASSSENGGVPQVDWNKIIVRRSTDSRDRHSVKTSAVAADAAVAAAENSLRPLGAKSRIEDPSVATPSVFPSEFVSMTTFDTTEESELSIAGQTAAVAAPVADSASPRSLAALAPELVYWPLLLPLPSAQPEHGLSRGAATRRPIDTGNESLVSLAPPFLSRETVIDPSTGLCRTSIPFQAPPVQVQQSFEHHRSPPTPPPIDPSLNLYIKGLAPDTTDDSLLTLASSFGARVKSHKAIIDPSTGQCKGFGFVMYATAPERAYAQNRLAQVAGLHVSMAKESFTAKLRRCADRDSNNLYIHGLPVQVDEAYVANLVRPFPVITMRILRDKTGISKGIALVRLDDHHAAKTCIDRLNGMVNLRSFGGHAFC